VKKLPDLSIRVADGCINKCNLLSTAQLPLALCFAATNGKTDFRVVVVSTHVTRSFCGKNTLCFVHAGQEHITTVSAVALKHNSREKCAICPAWICVIKPSDVDKYTKKKRIMSS
jgi:hypothetical protein